MLKLCPVCRGVLRQNGKAYQCENSHSFDIAKEGYVNLLLSNKAGENVGDNREMALSRRRLLSNGYYSVLAEGLCGLISSLCSGGELLDICCGEGYYSSVFAEKLTGFGVSGFDISKEMIRLAAKRKCRADFFVANMTDIPLPDKSIDAAVHLFAPFCADEFSRVLKDGGLLFSVIPGERHLYGLKELLYEKPYLNDEQPPEANGFHIVKKVKFGNVITLTDSEDIMALLKMTPYFYHTPTSGLDRLSKIGTLTTETDFAVTVFAKG